MSKFTTLNSIKNAYFVGIGGVSMSSLAIVLKKRGVNVSGYDMYHSENTTLLEDIGIKIEYEHNIESLKDIDTIIYTAAVTKETAPELSYAEENGIRLMSRAELLGEITATYKHAVGISGTHGKSTTTGMLASIYLKYDEESSILAGAKLPAINSTYKIGNSDRMVFEACEYKDSFLSMKPSLKVILNCEHDHVDYFKDIDSVKCSFKRFAEIKRYDEEPVRVLINKDCENTCDAIKDSTVEIFDYSTEKDAYFRAGNIEFTQGYGCFDFFVNKELKISKIKLSVPGLHNISNAVAAAGAAYLTDVNCDAIKSGLESFTGVTRRFEKKGDFNGCTIIDDYAHHPDEIRVTLNTAKSMEYNRIICVFQPHTYSRTYSLLNDFAKELSIADEVYLADIYPAREKNIYGVSSNQLASKIPSCKAVGSFEEITNILKESLGSGDLLITMGAGEAYKVGDLLIKN